MQRIENMHSIHRRNALSRYYQQCESAQEVVLSQLPDMILLDLELHEGGGNGLQFLYNLNRMQIPFRPYIVVTTHTTSEVPLRLPGN